MWATLMYGAGDVRVEEVPDPVVREPADAVVRVLRSAICGSDLWPYQSMPASEQGRPMGHEFLGVVAETGSEVSTLATGDVVWLHRSRMRTTPASSAAKACTPPAATAAVTVSNGVDGGQGEAVRVPQAQGTLVKLPVGEDPALLPSLLALSDVFPTGHHAAVRAGVNPRTSVTVIGDGAVGLCAVLAARRLKYSARPATDAR